MNQCDIELEEEQWCNVEDLRSYLFKRFPYGVIRGQSIKWMPACQVRAIYYSLTHPKPKNYPGQISLFDEDDF